MRNNTALAVGLLVLLWAWGGKSSKRKGALGGVRWTDAEFQAFRRAVEPTGVPVPVALQVYAAESGLNPKATSGAAWGIPQMIESTLRAVGWGPPPADFARLSAAGQAPWIGKLLAMQIKQIGFVPKTATDLYVANFSPLAASNHSDVIYRKGSQAYDANFQLDHGQKGYINRADLALRLGQAENDPAYRAALEQWERLRLPPERKAV